MGAGGRVGGWASGWAGGGWRRGGWGPGGWAGRAWGEGWVAGGGCPELPARAGHCGGIVGWRASSKRWKGQRGGGTLWGAMRAGLLDAGRGGAGARCSGGLGAAFSWACGCHGFGVQHTHSEGDEGEARLAQEGPGRAPTSLPAAPERHRHQQIPTPPQLRECRLRRVGPERYLSCTARYSTDSGGRTVPQLCT